MKHLTLTFFIIFLGSYLGAQNTPCTATSVTVGSSCTFTTYTNVGSTDSGIPDPSCGNYTSSGEDVWFVITVPTSGNIEIETQAGTLNDVALSIYTGPNCSSLTEVQCDDDDGPGTMPYIFQTGLTPGSSVWIRAWDYGGNNLGTFDLCAYEYSFSQQDCPGGETVCSDATFSGNSSGIGDFSELNGSNDGCLSGEHESSWYFFSPQTAGQIEFEIITSVDYDFAVWGPLGSATCPPNTSPLRCSYAGSNGNTGLASGSGDASENSFGDRYVNQINGVAGAVYILVIDNYTSDGSSFDLDWTLSGGATLDCTVLDIELVDFLAKKREENIELTWATATENKTDYFIVQRAGANGEFEDLETVDAKGGTNILTKYDIIDYAPLLGTSYYKLLEVTIDGEVIEYKTVSVVFESDLRFKIYPNPSQGDVNILSYKEIKGDITYQITDVRGVVNKRGEYNGQKSLFSFPVRSLSKGIYFISIMSNDLIIHREKIVIN